MQNWRDMTIDIREPEMRGDSLDRTRWRTTSREGVQVDWREDKKDDRVFRPCRKVVVTVYRIHVQALQA